MEGGVGRTTYNGGGSWRGGRFRLTHSKWNSSSWYNCCTLWQFHPFLSLQFTCWNYPPLPFFPPHPPPTTTKISFKAHILPIDQDIEWSWNSYNLNSEWLDYKKYWTLYIPRLTVPRRASINHQHNWFLVVSNFLSILKGTSGTNLTVFGSH